MADREAGSLPPAPAGTPVAAGPADPRALGTATRARLYHTVRTAHLERALELAPAPLLYGNRRYDFDPELAERVGATPAGALQAARLLGRSGVRDLEVNEPAAIETVARTAVSLAWLRLRHVLLRRPRPRVVTYAIGNSDPFAIAPGSRLRRRLKRRVEHLLARYVWWEIDRIAYGTPAAVTTYADAFGRAPGRQRSALVPALPAPCTCVDPGADRPDRVVFLGAFDTRKGLSLVLDSWPGVLDSVPGAELVVLGKGDLEARARAAAEQDASVRLVVDPPRPRIHEELRGARVLVLPSQPTPRWREQVGLPIVEALAHGCTVVTTDETGLAEWLTDHGHVVVPGTADAGRLATAVTAALRQRRAPHSVLGDLPEVDGRLAADAWMFAEDAAGR
jgi:glycosyltransferase involved in cell wall biosynthesis